MWLWHENELIQTDALVRNYVMGDIVIFSMYPSVEHALGIEMSWFMQSLSQEEDAN